MSTKYEIRINDQDSVLEFRDDHGRIEVRRDGTEAWHTCELSRVGGTDLYLLMIDNRPTEIYLERKRGGALVTIGRHVFDCDVALWRPGSKRGSGGTAAKGLVKISAPMTGGIVEVRVAPGEHVTRGQVVLVIESMKMNNELRSPAEGLVEQVAVSAGQRVTANELLVAIRTGPAEG